MSQDIEAASVKVVVRLRPLNDMEKEMGVTPAVSASTENKSVTAIKGHKLSRSVYVFDDVFTEFASQQEVFDKSISNVIDDVMRGYTSTVLAYGQTGTGKTHTMEGDISDPTKFGVIPRSINQIFETLQNNPDLVQSTVTCSYLEIYNEELSDLFADDKSQQREKLDIVNGPDGTYCKGLIEKEVKNLTDVLQLIRKAVQSRKIGETNMNKHSSRSHCVFTVHVYARGKSLDKATIDYHGKLHMVDLAGSENAKSSEIGSRSSKDGTVRERERKNINTSLLTLGRVIAAVKSASEGKKNIRVPYRDSKLTRVLQDAIGGRSKTVIIATVSPSELAISESISTLNYAQAANSIVNKPVADSTHLSSYSLDTHGSTSVEQWYELECKMKYMEAQVQEAKVALARKNQQEQILISRAKTLEDEIGKKEKVLRQAAERISGLEKACNDEKERNSSLLRELKLKEQHLIRTRVILEATQQTEVNLTSEARRLIDAIKASVNENDRMHQVLYDEKQNEIARKNATVVLQKSAAEVLGEIDSKVNAILQKEESFCNHVVKSSHKETKTSQAALISTTDTLKEISSHVKTVTGQIKQLSTNDDGVLSILEGNTKIIQNAVLEGKNKIKAGTARQSHSFGATRDQLTACSDQVGNLATQLKGETDEILKSFNTKIETTKSEVLDAAESLFSALSKISESRSNMMTQLSAIWSEVEHRSSDVLKTIESCSVGQYSRMSNSIERFSDSMKHLDEVNHGLQKHESIISSRGTSHAQDILSQKTMLTLQRKMFTEVQEHQKKVHASMVDTITKGLQKLLEEEFARLGKENDASFKTFATDNEELFKLNQTMEVSTNDMIREFNMTNASILNNLNLVAKNEKFFLQEAEKSNEAFSFIQNTAKEHFKFNEESGKIIDHKLSDLSSLDGPFEQEMKNFDAKKNEIVNYLSRDVQAYANDGVNRLLKRGNKISNFVNGDVIPSNIRALEDQENDSRIMFNDLSNHIQQIEDVSMKNKTDIKASIDKICDSTDELHQSITSKCSTFYKSVIASRMKELDTNCAGMIDDSSSHLKSQREALSTMQNLTSSVDNQLSVYSRDVIHTNDPVAPLDAKPEIEYSDQLSSTPAEHVILKSWSKRRQDVSQDENTFLSQPVPIKFERERRDDVSSENGRPLSHSLENF